MLEAVPEAAQPAPDPILWRIVKGNGTERIVDQAELDRLDGLKRRAYVGFSRCRIHQCAACGKRDAWRHDDQGDWGWYGSINQIDNWQGEQPAVPKWCSEACRLALIASRAAPRNMQLLDGC